MPKSVVAPVDTVGVQLARRAPPRRDTLWRRIAALALLPLAFLGGQTLAPPLQRAWVALFPEPEYREGDYRALHADAGSSVVLFGTATCPWCARVREQLAARGVSYREYRIDASAAARRVFEAQQGKVVPLLIVGQRRISGFRERVIDEALQALAVQAASVGDAGASRRPTTRPPPGS